MRTCFLTSNFSNNFTESFEREFKKYSQGNKIFVFVGSSFDNYSKTDRYCKYFVDLFKKINIVFEEVKIIDYRVAKEEVEEIIVNADMVWLAGGDTIKQMHYFEEYNLRAVFQKYQGIIIGMSAGSINMADDVILAKDEDDNVPELSKYKGLGLVSISIEPHLDLQKKKHIEEIKEASKTAPIYGLFDDSFILVRNDKIEIFGEYKIFDEKSDSLFNRYCE